METGTAGGEGRRGARTCTTNWHFTSSSDSRSTRIAASIRLRRTRPRTIASAISTRSRRRAAESTRRENGTNGAPSLFTDLRYDLIYAMRSLRGESVVHDRRAADVDARDWRQHGHLQRHQRGDVAAAAVPRRRASRLPVVHQLLHVAGWTHSGTARGFSRALHPDRRRRRPQPADDEPDRWRRSGTARRFERVVEFLRRARRRAAPRRHLSRRPCRRSRRRAVVRPVDAPLRRRSWHRRPGRDDQRHGAPGCGGDARRVYLAEHHGPRIEQRPATGALGSRHSRGHSPDDARGPQRASGRVPADLLPAGRRPPQAWSHARSGAAGGGRAGDSHRARSS